MPALTWKRRKEMKKSVRKLLILMLVMIMAFGTMTISASAKTKSIKPKSCGFATSTSTANKKATTVRTGSYAIKVPSKQQFYLKFTAPKTKNYTFTSSAFKSKNGNYTCGHGYIMTKYGNNGQSITMADVKTQGGKNSSLYYSIKSDTSGAKKYRYLSSRYATIKLNKGETVYIYYSFAGGMKSFNLSIK